MDERCCSRPIFRRGKRIEDFGDSMSFDGACKQLTVVERRNVHRPQDREHGVPGFARHCKSMVETSHARAGRGDHQAVKDVAAFLVGVEAIAEQLPEEPSALGYPNPITRCSVAGSSRRTPSFGPYFR